MIPLFKVFMAPTMQDPLMTTIHSGQITQGKKVNELEEQLKIFFSHPYVITTNSATSGLTLAFKLCNTRMIISTPLTCLATTCAMFHPRSDVELIWTDVDSSCRMMLDGSSPSSLYTLLQTLNEDITICIVHWGGYVLDMDRLVEITDDYHLRTGKKVYIVEDSSHALGARWENQSVGTNRGLSTHLGVFSFQAIKHLTTGDGGAMLLPNEEMYQRAKLLRWYGIDREKTYTSIDQRLEDDVKEMGFKFHMNDINATIGLENIKHTNEILKRCRDNGKYYDDAFQIKRNVKEQSSPWIYTIHLPSVLQNLGFHLLIDEIDPMECIEYMKKENIQTSQVHKRNDVHSCLKKYQKHLPCLDQLQKEYICIPVGCWVDRMDREYIVKTFLSFLQYKEEELFALKVNLLQNDPDELLEYTRLLSHLTQYIYDKPKILYPQTLQSIYVIKKGQRIIACAKCFIEEKFGDNVGHIEDVVVHPDFRGQGIGKRLITFLLNTHIKDCYKIVLGCKIENVSFYEKCGMKSSGVLMEKRK